MARVLITGAGGFVGRVLGGRLVEAGHDVWGVERRERPLPEGVTPCVADLSDGESAAAVLDEARPDWIVHLAAQSSVRASFDDPAGTLESNTRPALRLLEAMRRGAAPTAARILVVGSADAYGVVPPERLPVPEDAPLDPQSPYALSKAMQEATARMWAERFDVDAVITRSFNHTGPGQRDAFVLSSFARQVAAVADGRAPAVLRVGNLDVRRDFTDVRDVCDAYVALLERGERGQVYNVCSGRAVGLRDVLSMLCDIAGVSVRVEVDPDRLRPVDMPELRGDPSKIERDTGWRARIPLEQTLRDLLAWWSEVDAQASAGRTTDSNGGTA